VPGFAFLSPNSIHHLFMRTIESFFVSQIPDRFELIVGGNESSENPAYWNPVEFFNPVRPIDAYAIDIMRCKDTGQIYFSTQHIQYELGARTVLGYTIKLINSSYATALRLKNENSNSSCCSETHDGPIDNTAAILRSRAIEEWIKAILLNDLNELKRTMGAGAFRSAIGCCGRVLEGVLKTIFIKNNLKFDDSWPLGKLLSQLGETGMYLDPSAKNMANIINSHRISAVHCKRDSRLPIPSENDSAGIMYLTLGLIERCLIDSVTESNP
jgi:hypothetical protein